MYGRAPRVTYLTVGSTTSEVGPGSYEVIQYKTKKSDGYAPFLSLSNRPSMFHRSSNDKALPGPGQYNSSHSKDNILGGQSLKNRSKRFDEVVSEVPGPGTYNVRQAAGNTLRGAESEPPGKRRTKVWLQGVPTRLNFLPQPDIPSIPSPGQAFGYEDNGQGFLCKQKAPAKDDTLGPAFYNPVVAETSFSLKYKGVHFGKMTGKRGEVKGVEGPGPGQYDPEEYSTTEYENVNVRKGQKSRAELVVPRYHEIVTLQEEKKGVPVQASTTSGVSLRSRAGPYGNLPVFSPPFLSQAQRFSPVKELAPPVGMYNDPRCALEILKKTTGMQRNPFGLTAVRFLPDSRKQSTPGPGAYNMFEYGLAQDSMKKAYLESTRKGGFGSTAQRSLVFHNNDEVPGPGQYKRSNMIYFFARRFDCALCKMEIRALLHNTEKQDTPPPSSYNVRESFEKTYGRASFSGPRSEGGRKRQSSFLSAAPRHSSFLSCDPDFPGPGQYSPDIKSSPQMALIVSREDRFKGPKNTNPGPGTYELSPAIMDTVLKGTFNVTLNNPLSNHYPAPHLLSAMPPPLTHSSV
ncbi:sperm-tail PG-rich repeat-containing protein 2 [Salvelinus sp. IW2-2015]|uniref:sperm-tail PG-rich repeat-containing protein 2 n=1 Tax=Salvelinus sp. IW2-2015 TaxID=2691554 RepID=UPI0038D42214